jgi:hypothetical protein
VEPFKVTCVTCRARLTVRDESAIGQILACPRCSSMVHVAAPAAGAAAVTSAIAKPAAAAAAPTDDSFSFDVDEAPTPRPPTPAHEAATFDDAVDMGGPVEQVVAPPAPIAPPPVGGWGPLKFAAVTAGAALAGSALVAATLTWWNRNDAPALPTSAPSPPAAAAAASQPTAEPSALPIATDDPAANELAATAPPPPSEPSTPATDPDLDLVFDPPAANNANAAPVEPAPDLGTGRLSDQSDPAEDAPLAVAPPEEPQPRLRIDPLQFDPEGLNLTMLREGPATNPLEASQSAAPTSADATASMTPPTVPEAAAGSLDPADAPVRREAPDADADQPDAASLAARKFPAVKVDGMPLAQFIDFAGEMSGLAISVAPEVLRRAAVSSATAVKCDAKDAAIEELLAAALAPLRLAPHLDGNQLVLERRGGDKQRQVDYKIDDLAADDAVVKQFAERLQRFAAPETWQTAGGEAKLAIDGQTLRADALESTQYEALFFLERYRQALSLPTRSRYPARMLAPSSAYADVAERLQAPTTFTFSQYTPLREIFRYWQDELGLAVLVDWPALARERLTPQTRIAAGATDQPWAEALDAVLTPLGLAWRAIDARTIEITSLEKDRLQPETAFYRLAPDAKVDAKSISDKVDQIAAATADEVAAPPAAAVASDYDAAHRLLMVRLPAAAHRRFAAWLAEQSLLTVD